MQLNHFLRISEFFHTKDKKTCNSETKCSLDFLKMNSVQARYNRWNARTRHLVRLNTSSPLNQNLGCCGAAERDGFAGHLDRHRIGRFVMFFNDNVRAGG